jgi:hypothetical protein
MVYGQETYVRSGAVEKWEHQAPFGFACGVASAFHLPQNQHFLFGVDWVAPLPTHRIELTELVANIHLFATFVQCALRSVLNTRSPVERRMASQIRKLECATKPQAVVKALRLGLIH